LVIAFGPDYLRQMRRILASNVRGEYDIVHLQLEQIERRLMRLADPAEYEVHDPDLDPLMLPAVRSLRAKVEARLQP
jgi:hypothetical protein